MNNYGLNFLVKELEDVENHNIQRMLYDYVYHYYNGKIEYAQDGPDLINVTPAYDKAGVLVSLELYRYVDDPKHWVIYVINMDD